MVEHETSSTKTMFAYNADYAQGKAEYEIEMTARGALSKQGKDMVLAEKIKDLIADKKQPYAVFRHSRTLHAPAKHESERIRCTITLSAM